MNNYSQIRSISKDRIGRCEHSHLEGRILKKTVQQQFGPNMKNLILLKNSYTLRVQMDLDSSLSTPKLMPIIFWIKPIRSKI